MPDQLTLFAYSESEGKYYMQGAEFIKMFHVECLGDGFPKQAGLYSLDDIDEDSLKEYVYFVKEFDHIYKGDSD